MDFSQSKITPILFPANSPFLLMVLYLKTKMWNPQKVSEKLFAVPVMDNSYSTRRDYLILMFTYNTDCFPDIFFSFEPFFKHKIENKDFVWLNGDRLYPNQKIALCI